MNTPLLRILKLKLKYKIDVIDAYNMVFGLKTNLKFYFNNGQQMVIKRLSHGNRLTNEMVVKEIDKEDELNLISIYMNTNEFIEFEADDVPEAIYNLIHNKETEEFTYREE